MIPETDQAREDRKRRKEAKKAERARLAAGPAMPAGAMFDQSLVDQGAQPVMQAPTPMTNGAPTPGSSASFAPGPGIPNGIEVKREKVGNAPVAARPQQQSRPSQHQQQVQSRPNGKASRTPVSTPSALLQNNTNRHPNPQQSQPPHQQHQRPQATAAPTRMNLTSMDRTQASESLHRGVKRERPGTPSSQQHTHTNQVFPHNHAMVHPSTAKKRRIESAAAVR